MSVEVLSQGAEEVIAPCPRHHPRRSFKPAEDTGPSLYVSSRGTDQLPKV